MGWWGPASPPRPRKPGCTRLCPAERHQMEALVMVQHEAAMHARTRRSISSFGLAPQAPTCIKLSDMVPRVAVREELLGSRALASCSCRRTACTGGCVGAQVSCARPAACCCALGERFPLSSALPSAFPPAPGLSIADQPDRPHIPPPPRPCPTCTASTDRLKRLLTALLPSHPNVTCRSAQRRTLTAGDKVCVL